MIYWCVKKEKAPSEWTWSVACCQQIKGLSDGLKKERLHVELRRSGTLIEGFWQLFGGCVTAWRFGNWGGLRCCLCRLALSATGRGRGRDGVPPQDSAHSPGDERWQPGPNRISTPSHSGCVCVRGWGGGAPLAMINGPLVWFCIFLGCVYYLPQCPWLSKRAVVHSNSGAPW